MFVQFYALFVSQSRRVRPVMQLHGHRLLLVYVAASLGKLFCSATCLLNSLKDSILDHLQGEVGQFSNGQWSKDPKVADCRSPYTQWKRKGHQNPHHKGQRQRGKPRDGTESHLEEEGDSSKQGDAPVQILIQAEAADREENTGNKERAAEGNVPIKERCFRQRGCDLEPFKKGSRVFPKHRERVQGPDLESDGLL